TIEAAYENELVEIRRAPNTGPVQNINITLDGSLKLGTLIEHYGTPCALIYSYNGQINAAYPHMLIVLREPVISPETPIQYLDLVDDRGNCRAPLAVAAWQGFASLEKFRVPIK